MDAYQSQLLALWGSPEFQALLAPFRTLSSVSAMFWMLAKLSDLALAALKKLIFDEVGALLGFLYAAALAAAYAALMFYTSLQGQWHPSLLWREICGFAFMYVMLGVTFTDTDTGRLKPGTPAAFALGVCAYLFLARAPGLARQPQLAEFHRVLELFAAGGWGTLMTALTVTVAAWSLLRRAAAEISFGLSPLLYRLRLIKALPVRFDFREGGRGMAPSLARSWFILTLLAGAAAMGAWFWPRLKAAGEAEAAALQTRAQSPEAAEAAAKLRRVLPAVSFSAVSSMPRGGAMAEFSAAVFRGLLQAPREADRWLAAAALDRLDPSFRISEAELFTSTPPAASDCASAGRRFRLLAAPLPGDEAAKAVTFWFSDDRGVHFSGVGPGELSPVPGAGGCAAAIFPSAGAALLAFDEAPVSSGAARHLWFAAYDPQRREALGAVRAAASATGDFALSPWDRGALLADAPAAPRAEPCPGGCGRVEGVPVRSVTAEQLPEYRGALVERGAPRVAALAELTYERSGLKAQYASPGAFGAAFGYDPAAGFLNRWYRRALLEDGRSCVTAAADPALPGSEQKPAWACGR